MKKELKLNEVEKAVGGTVTEFAEILEAAAYNPAVEVINVVGGHIPAANVMVKPVVEGMLSLMGITADISLGLAGTGLGSEANKYWRNGQRISHQEVLRIVRGWSSKISF